MLKIGDLIDNKYRILDIVGRGGMSVVYLARNERANKSWAVKEVKKVGEENLEIKKNSLIAETEMLKKLSHENLPAIVDVIETSDTYLVVMDYIEGNDLGEILQEYGAQPQEKVIEWALQLCDVLNYLHTQNPPIIYRDLKPANIMLKPNNAITLIDFGTAREAKNSNAADTISLGTKGYAAPEQFGDHAKTDARTDIYCLGATLYHLVTGHNPATEPYIMDPITQKNPMLSSGLEKIILKCTMPNPEDRYQSCAELMYALQHYETEDTAYRNKQKRKLASFIASVSFTLIFITLTILSNVFINSKLSEDYTAHIQKAEILSKDEQTFDEAYDAYVKAIAISPGNETAYMGLLSLIESDGILDDNRESGILLKLKNGLDVYQEDNKTLEKTLYPLEELRNNNSDYYENFCYHVGLDYWFLYEEESLRKTEALNWMNAAIDASGGESENFNYEIAKLYSGIASCKKDLRRNWAEPEKDKTYKELWKKISELYQSSLKMESTENKLLAWKEILFEFSNEIIEFIDRVPEANQKNTLNMLNSIHQGLMALEKTKMKAAEKELHLSLVDDSIGGTTIDSTITQVKNAYKLSGAE